MLTNNKEHRLTAIVGEQEFFIRDMLRTILEKSGCDVVAEAENGPDIVAKYVEIRPDIALIDVIMPMKDGIAVTREILSFDEGARVVLCATKAHATLARTGIMAGAVDILLKPYRMEQVREVLLKLRRPEPGISFRIQPA